MKLSLKRWRGDLRNFKLKFFLYKREFFLGLRLKNITVNTFHLSFVACFLQLTESFPARLNFLFEVYLALSNEAKSKINLVLMDLVTSLKRKGKVILLSVATKQQQQYRELRFMWKLFFRSIGSTLVFSRTKKFFIRSIEHSLNTFVTAFMWLLWRTCIEERLRAFQHFSRRQWCFVQQKIHLYEISLLDMLCKSTSNRTRT